eukprot:750833_1
MSEAKCVAHDVSFEIDIYGILNSLRCASSGNDLKHFFVIYGLLLQIRDSSPFYHERFGSILSHQFLQYIEADEHMYKSVVLDQKNKKYHVKYARLGRRMDKCYSAIKHYKYAIHSSLKPNNDDLKEGYFNIGYLYLHLQQYKLAMKYCIKSLSYDEHYIFGLYCRASIYFHTLQYELAEQAFETLLSKANKSALYIYFVAEYAIIKLNLGYYKYAKKRLKQQLLRTTENESNESNKFNNTKTWFAMTCYAYILSYGYHQNQVGLEQDSDAAKVTSVSLQSQAKLKRKILKIFNNLMQTAMKNYYFRYYYAMSNHYFLNDYQCAEYSYNCAIERFPNVPITYMHYANLLFEMKQYDKAKEMLHESVQRNVGNIQAINKNYKTLTQKLKCVR